MENLAAQLPGEIWDGDQEGPNENFEIEVEDEVDRDGETLDGGVAVNPDDAPPGNKRSLDCDSVIDIAPNHPVLRPGITVSIGLDKNTKLSAVFNRYVDFCNKNRKTKDEVDVNGLEFVHCQLLNGNDTMEASALMKSDKILVRKIRTAEREAETDRRRQQRDADRNYFQQLRHLLPDLGGSKTSDVILDCQGKLVDESGRNQQVLCTTVRAHSVILSKRCPWLGDIFRQARNEPGRRAPVEVCGTPNTNDSIEESSREVRRVESDIKSPPEQDEEDDGSIEVLSFPPKDGKGVASGATEIENDEDDDDDQPFDEPRENEDQPQPGSPVHIPHQLSHQARKDLLWVTLPDHSPEAVKLLLEYCYTNRVIPLGQEAFVQACRSKPHKHQGPVPPYHNTASGSRRWPDNGNPQVSFSVALAGIALAEEAGMHRLSLMCEVAASQLVCQSNVLEALSMCTHQQQVTGNDLPRLRKAAMEIVLRGGPRGVAELERTPAFRMALGERSAIVPTLLRGTMEAVATHEKSRGVKRERPHSAELSFLEVDREDSFKREKERRKRREERGDKGPARRVEQGFDEEMDDMYDPILSGWAAETARRSLKRMHHHLDSMAATHRAFVLTKASGMKYGPTGRRSSGRQRNSQS